jgi:hypothetical protein
MGKAALTQELEKILKETERFREGVVDTYEHVYPVDAKKITDQVKLAIASVDPTISTSRVVANEVSKYTQELFDRFNRLRTTSRTATYVVIGQPNNFVVRCTSKKGEETNIFARINDVRTGSLGAETFKQPKNWSSLSPEEQSALKKNFNQKNTGSPLSRLRQRILLRLFDISLQDIDLTQNSRTLDTILGPRQYTDTNNEFIGRRGGLLHLGHLDGFAVIERRAAVITSLIKERTGIDVGRATISKSIRNRRKFKLAGEFAEITLDLNIDVNTTVVKDEFAGINISKVFEKNILPQITKAFLNRKNWHKYPGSIPIEGALLDDASSDILDSISSLKNNKNLKVAVKKSRSAQSRKPSKSKDVRIKLSGTKTKSRGESDNFPTSTGSPRRQVGMQARPGSNAQNWARILPILNTKLPPKVVANMNYPSLVNRTGTFANSAKIVAVEQTREGFPSFVYDYERDPYDVFDRTLGRSPWNTPARDPKAIVDKSVRELVREMAIGRFFTRRA